MRSRVTITIPDDLLAAADSKAQALDRSRSWVIAEAVRGYLSETAPPLVREPAAGYAIGLGPARQAQLQADLALTPEARVRLAEQTAALNDRVARRPPQRDRILFFDRIEDYFAWERRESLDV